MSDSRRTSKPRQVRVEFSGGVADIEEFREALNEFAEARGWAITLSTEPVRFGDVGPLHRCRVGYIQTPEPSA